MSEAYSFMPKISFSDDESPLVSDIRETLIDECVCDALLCTVILENLDDPVWLAALADILENEPTENGVCSVHT